tara:strand:- start:1416 stop:2573 length:1158 start_codon:yes stop_codon:yes gene_type:complete
MKLKKGILFFLLVGSLFGYSLIANSQEKGKFNLILDTDMAIDDWPAVLYVLNQRSRANILGITVPGTGEAHCKNAIRNVLKLIYLVGREKENIKVSCGDEVPMEGVHAFPDAWRKDVDNFYGISIPTSPQKLPPKIHSVEHMREMIKKSKKPVVILTLGPLTNMGQLIQKYGDEVTKKIKRIYVMGGTIKAKGNVIVPNFTDNLKNKVAEWNIWIDPLAAQITYRSGIPITMVGLDATNQVQVTRKFAADFKAHAKSKGAKFTDNILVKNGWFIDSGEYFFWDPLTAVAVFEPICNIETLKVDVNVKEQKGMAAKTQLSQLTKTFAKLAINQYRGKVKGRKALDEKESGRTFVSKSSLVKNIQVCMSVKDKKTFFKSYMKILNKY